MKTGVIGGTFNPIHNGHIHIAHELVKKCQLDRAIFIPAALPPHKDSTTMVAFTHRLAMVRLAVEPWANFSVSDIEHPQRGISYSVDTMKILHRHYPQDSFYFLMGMDSFNNLSSWHQYQQLFTLTNIVVAYRPCTTKIGSCPPTDTTLPQLPVAIREQFCYDLGSNQYRHSSGQRLSFLEDTCIDISSTAIRARIAAQQSVATMLPDQVNEYIHAHRLYVRHKRE